MNKNQEILSLAVLAGEILIKNGGEIFRVEDTMMRIIESYGIKDYNVYVLSQTEFLPPLMNRAATPTVWSAMLLSAM